MSAFNLVEAWLLRDGEVHEKNHQYLRLGPKYYGHDEPVHIYPAVFIR